MMAVWLVIVVCAGSACEVMELPTEGPLSCAMAGQAIAAEWIRLNHPDATLRRWKCSMDRPI